MANIVLVRIDERLLHGQIRITWKYSGANTIIVANDEIAANPVLQAPFKGAAGGEYVVLFRTIEHLIGSINKADERRRILILCKTPEDVARLVEEESVLMKSTSVICIIIPNGNKLTKMFPLVRWIFRPLNAFN